MKVLSLYDGMACGALALQAAGIEIESYDAFEIDKYAIQTATHNFPFIKQHGDVFKADFTQLKGVDLVCGGSPCTYWTIAQKNNRETEASGMGWELFQQFVRAIKEAEPKYFVYENNKSMSKAIRQSIDEAFGFEAVLINSALVSAQNRQRLYWVGKRNADGTYSKVDVEQPKDRGILLRDILETTTDASLAVPVETETLSDEYYHGNDETAVFGKIECKNTSNNNGQPAQGTRVYKTDNKSICLDTDSRKYIIDKYSPAFVDVKGKKITIYEVKNGLITIKGKQYPIKLADGFYIIRKLTVRECMRLQTVPEWYEFPVSNSQARKLLGNGWTVAVISIIFANLKERD